MVQRNSALFNIFTLDERWNGDTLINKSTKKNEGNTTDLQFSKIQKKWNGYLGEKNNKIVYSAPNKKLVVNTTTYLCKNSLWAWYVIDDITKQNSIFVSDGITFTKNRGKWKRNHAHTNLNVDLRLREFKGESRQIISFVCLCHVLRYPRGDLCLVINWASAKCAYISLIKKE